MENKSDENKNKKIYEKCDGDEINDGLDDKNIESLINKKIQLSPLDQISSGIKKSKN